MLSNTCPSEEQPAYPTGNFHPEMTGIPCVWALRICSNRPIIENCIQFTSKCLTDLACLRYILHITEHNLLSGLLTIHIVLKKRERMSTQRQQTQHSPRDIKLKAREVDAHSCAHQLHSSSIRPKTKIAIHVMSSIQISFRKRKIHGLYWRQRVFLSLNWT